MVSSLKEVKGLSYEEVMNKIDFPVALKRMQTEEGVLAEDFIGVQRTDTGKVLSIVSPSYKLVSHGELLRKPLEYLSREGYTFQRASLIHGGRAVYLQVIGKEGFMVGKDMIHPTLRGINSYDKTHVLDWSYGAFRLVCTNGLMVPVKLLGFDKKELNTLHLRKRHIGDIQDAMEILKERLESYQSVFSRLQGFYQSLDDRKISAETAKKLLNTLFSEKMTEKIIVLWDKGDAHEERTAWTLYNALTQYQRDSVAEAREDMVGGRLLRQEGVQSEFLNALLMIGN
jgi:hypothetical protein